MSANDSLERRIADFYESEAPPRAPDWVLQSALDTVNDTRQRRVLIHAPRRFPQMNSFAKLAIAAVIVIAVGAVGLRALAPSSPSGVGAQPTASPSPSPSPASSPSPSASPVTPALTETFTSNRNGFSISYPTGWVTRPATDPWTAGVPDFMATGGDIIFDPVLQADLWIVVASQPLGGKVGETWTTDLLNDPETDCGTSPREPVTVDGATGLLCGGVVAVSVGDRGYFIRLYTGSGAPAAYDRAYFEGILATVKLLPGDAVDTSASPSA